MLTTTVPNGEWQNGSAYSTQDKVFIPSTTELGDTEHEQTYRISDAYAFFSNAGDEKRSAMMGGEGWYETIQKLWGEDFLKELGLYKNMWCYLTRSPDSSSGGYVRSVYVDFTFYGLAAGLGNIGVRPALNLKSDTLVSEVGD